MISTSAPELSITPFELTISYAQIAVFHAGLENPFNDWTETHVRQGFSWRPESVSFATLEESGKARIYVNKVEELALRSDTVRAIQVPLTVPETKLVEVASITESKVIEIGSGGYALTFETGFDEGHLMWCAITFQKSNRPIARILRADQELNPPEDLLLSATPAT
jgi:hypothetical protein